ncbi:MAG TPA: LysE family transporter [Burkholderiales bacterium]|nr:LysE family transporter [Burkholderiales bacterium]
MASYLLPIGAVALAHLAAAMSPGPSFLIVAKTAASGSRRAGVAAALAMGVGAAVWASAALTGLAVLFARFSGLYLVAQAAGGLFLIWVGLQIWRHARAPLPEPGAAKDLSGAHAFRSALWIQLSNPKVAVFFGSIFVAILPRDLPFWLRGVVLAVIFVDEFLWYATVALALSSPRARRAYARFKPAIERATACLLCLLGLRFVLDFAA